MKGEILWQGQPSQAQYCLTYVLCFLFFPLLVPLFYAWRVYNGTKQTFYQVTSLHVTRLNHRKASENRLLEMGRIESIEITFPKHHHLSKTYDLVFKTGNPAIPPLVFQAIRDARRVKEIVEQARENSLRVRNVQEIRLPILQGM